MPNCVNVNTLDIKFSFFIKANCVIFKWPNSNNNQSNVFLISKLVLMMKRDIAFIVAHTSSNHGLLNFELDSSMMYSMCTNYNKLDLPHVKVFIKFCYECICFIQNSKNLTTLSSSCNNLKDWSFPTFKIAKHWI